MLERSLRVSETIREKIEKAREEGINLSEVVGKGASGSETEVIDRIAEDVIIESFPDISILSEEAGFIDRKSEKILIVDPIDGTKNGIRNIPLYSVSLAIGEKDLGDVTVGFVQNLVTKEYYYAEKGNGAYYNGKKMERMNVNDKPLACIHPEFRDYTLLEMIGKKGFWNIRSLGAASLEMCFVATGSADLYLHSKRSLRVIDIAASLLILREAGGECYDFETKEKLNRKLNLKERFGLIAFFGDNHEILNSI
jgi:Archaeal fructose-1,6-bisphosphatase and related enzymes of inositol monophosphatase family